jgi:hypothetical protein
MGMRRIHLAFHLSTDERAQSESTSLEEERWPSSAQIASILIQGYRTLGHYFWRGVAEDGAAIGSRWVHLRAE